jgi:hypothetical protein
MAPEEWSLLVALMGLERKYVLHVPARQGRFLMSCGSFCAVMNP